MKKFFNEFKTFISRGNVMDMAIGVVIATAFGKISASLVADIIMPLIGCLIGGVDLATLNITLKPAERKIFKDRKRKVHDLPQVDRIIYGLRTGKSSRIRKRDQENRPRSPVLLFIKSSIQVSRSCSTRFSSSGILSFCGHFGRQAPQFTHAEAGAPRWIGDIETV